MCSNIVCLYTGEPFLECTNFDMLTAERRIAATDYSREIEIGHPGGR